MKGLIATATIVIDAPIGDVWAALTDAARAKKYFFGSDIATDWQVGSSITWSGVWNGKPYEDKGTIVKNEEDRVLAYTHYSPLTGKPDVSESYHTVEIGLEAEGDTTKVTLMQDNNADETSRAHSEGNWKMMLESLKKEVEAGS